MKKKKHSFEEAQAVKKKYIHTLMSKKGVVACGTGYKHSKTSPDEKEPTIICYVLEKKPLSELSPEDVIPRELEGVPTKVIEVGRIKALN